MEWEIFNREKIRIKPIQTDWGEDMKHRPKLFRFLKGIQKRLLKVPYKLIREAFDSSLNLLCPYDKDIIHDHLSKNWSISKIAKKHDISKGIAWPHLKKAEGFLRSHIYQQFENKLPGGCFENTKTKSRH